MGDAQGSLLLSLAFVALLWVAYSSVAVASDPGGMGSCPSSTQEEHVVNGTNVTAFRNAWACAQHNGENLASASNLLLC